MTALNQPLEGLIERVSKAAAGNLVLDAAIAEAFEEYPAGWSFKENRGYPMWFSSKGASWQAHKYTSSIDAAFGFAERMLPGYRWGVSSAPIKDGAYPDGKTKYADGFKAHLTKNSPIRPMPTIGEARTPALAIILATLRAIQSTKTGDGE